MKTTTEIILETIAIIALVFAVFVTFLLPLTARGSDRWTTIDTASEITFAAIVAVDYAQTRWNLDTDVNGDGRLEGYEQNPLLGRHPSRAALGAWCLASVAAHAAVSYVLPREWRTAWNVVTITVEAANVGLNFDHQYRVTGGVHLAF